ncbi:16S rRNA (cytosine(1402)-N(4))-methyltransferase RsmH [Membranicola marinus]|uniref:Ribosomal RNA small subunit methyltransferase H n=1 Tax=Membranihabitans marinus TaxID=1227546 RepID=A0A953LAG5_9BACT|nr:16S rRNA (cytosine(1402)-N(4))-methyltransferase RsmH [Membranihabitans marinus]MBY5957551.1 16S rRNA (cytosine(1402)-N(4))-methyltransferase RsmH [Membranihabitans marinus]
MSHFSVLREEAVSGLRIREGGVYVDGTFGAGGHSREILGQLGGGVLYGFDQDLSVLQAAYDDSRLRLRHNNFADMVDVLKADGIGSVDGVLVDLGVSSMQFDQGERGFSYRFSAPLDMRMNQNAARTARQVLNDYSMEQLWYMFSDYGEIRNSKNLAEAVVDARKVRPIETTLDLVAIAESNARGSKMRYLSQVFQAVRIEVNDEMGVLKKFLKQLPEIVAVGGRVVVISFHSLEDRLVKNYLKHGSFDRQEIKDSYGKSIRHWRMITKKPVLPDSEEVKQNSRSRSAKMRIGERLG